MQRLQLVTKLIFDVGMFLGRAHDTGKAATGRGMMLPRLMRPVVSAVALVAVLGGTAVPAHSGPDKAAEPGDVVPPVRACAGLVGTYDLSGARTSVEQAEEVPAAGADPAYCGVRGRIEPAIKFQLKLPLETYAGRYLQVGCGAYCGVIPALPFPDCGADVPGDVATAGTDNGHVGGGEFPFLDTSWARDDQQARNDLFYRAPHALSRASKAIIEAFYGKPPRASYFEGCSMGGREGLLLAQRYPHDFDGIIAAAPQHYMGPGLGAYLAWIVQANVRPDGSEIVTIEKLRVLHEAVLNACDTLDGLADRQLEDPRTCSYDPGALRCKPGVDGPTCLTAEQVTAMRKLYTGPTDAHGRRLYPGALTRGGELSLEGWLTRFPGFQPFAVVDANAYLQNLGYPIGTPHSSAFGYQFTLREFHRLTPEGRKGNAMSLDLSAFRAAGGKLLLWHGWDDNAIPAHGTVDYYSRLAERNGGLAKTQKWARLFMIPTGYHCLIGGSQLNSFTPFDELLAWVERGKAPDQIIATGHEIPSDPTSPVRRSRPVFPYPLVATYDGSGSIDDAANFAPGPPIVSPHHDQIDWAGEYLHHLQGPAAR